MKVYIKASETISPQDTFLQKEVPESIVEYTSILKKINPKFKDYFSPLESRRINKLIKASHICALETIKQSTIEKPEAIITASGLGCVESTEKFLNDMLSTDEGLIAPTAFIQSTSNAVGGQIALHYKCKGYNVLYANKSFSFENALLDSLLRIKDKEETAILLGAFDEITPDNYALKQKVNIFKESPFSNLEILNSTTSGSIPGEGSTFFLLSADKTEAQAEIAAVYQNISALDTSEIKNWISNCCEQQGISLSEIDLVLAGLNGDKETNTRYNQVLNELFSESSHAYYKHYCGEYDTASAFGTWFATKAIVNNKIPKSALISDKKRDYKTVLVYNQLNSAYHSLIFLKK